MVKKSRWNEQKTISKMVNLKKYHNSRFKLNSGDF